MAPGQARQNHVRRHQLQVDEALAHRPGHRRAEQEGRHEIEKRGPHHRLKRRQDARGHDGGDRVGGIVKAIDVIEHQRDRR